MFSRYRTKLSLSALLLAALAGVATGATAESLRDPTQPPLASANPRSVAPLAPLRVEAIFRSGRQHTAIVDGKLVRRGDRVGTALIEEITHDSVRYSRGGRSEVTRLKHSKFHVRRSASTSEEES